MSEGLGKLIMYEAPMESLLNLLRRVTLLIAQSLSVLWCLVDNVLSACFSHMIAAHISVGHQANYIRTL